MNAVPNSSLIRTAGQWELSHGPAIIEWLRSSGIAQRMLADVCMAVEATVSAFVGGSPEAAKAVIEEFPRVLKECDSLDFDTREQALAYLILHLPARFLRCFHTLERLLLAGVLPIGKGANFAAIDIGAGPGPGIIAIRSFYAALAHYVSLQNDSSWQVATLEHAHVVERSRAMPSVMHYYAEMLLVVERGQPTAQGVAPSTTPNPCMVELEASALAFHARYDDFAALDIHQRHHEARRDLAYELYSDPYDNLSWADASQIAYESATDRPSGYALAVMMNFLTTTEAIPLFSAAIDKLMRGSLVPGGLILVLGAPKGSKYEAIYQEMDRRAQVARLNVIKGFETPLQTAETEAEQEALANVTRTIWRRLEALAGDVSQIEQELRDMKAADIYDESVRFQMPDFKVRAYHRGKLPKKQRVTQPPV